MKIIDIFKKQNLEDTVLIGYYGGGNYGDELLMEVLSNLFAKHGVKNLSIMYQTPETFKTWHHDFGYTLVPSADKKQLLKTILKNKNVVIGGGGLWGLDVNNNIFLLSMMLFIARRILGKNVYLLGVGYYSSTNKMGHRSAWLAAKAANVIFARDPETVTNFSRYNKHVHIDTDIAWYIKDLDLSVYEPQVAELEKQLTIAPQQKTLFVTLRRFNPKYKNNLTELLGNVVAKHQGPVIVALMEPKNVDPEGYELISQWQKQHSNVQIIDFTFNPLALYLFFQKYSKQLVLVAPQFHALITAHLTGVPFMPLTYDNKSTELLKQLGYEKIYSVYELQETDITKFVSSTIGK